jgi:hypothetical protein
MTRLHSAFASALLAAAVFVLVGRAAPPACDADNGGLKLPTGFCAAVVAENVARARHLIVEPNGDVFVSTSNGRGGRGGVVALRDTNGDGKRCGTAICTWRRRRASCDTRSRRAS